MIACVGLACLSLRAQEVVPNSTGQAEVLAPTDPNDDQAPFDLNLNFRMNPELEFFGERILGHGHLEPVVVGLNFGLGSMPSAELAKRRSRKRQFSQPAVDHWTQAGANGTARIGHGFATDRTLIVSDKQVQRAGYLETDSKPDSTSPNRLRTQESATDDSTSTLIEEENSIEGLTKRIQDQKQLLNENESLEEISKSAQLNQLSLASVSLQKAVTAQSLIDQRNAARDEFKNDLARKQGELAAPAKPMSPEEASTHEVLQLELQEKRQQLQEAKNKQSLIQSQIEQRDKRIIELPGLRTAATEQLRAIKQRLVELELQPHDLASTLALNAQELAAKKEIESLDIESARQEQVGKLLPLERDVITRRIGTLEIEISAWETAYNRRREFEIAEQQRQAHEAWQKVIDADPRLADLAKGNQELANRRGELTEKIKKHNAELTEAQSTFDEIDSKLSTLRQKVETGLTPANGMLLVEHKHNLLQPFESQAKIVDIKSELQKYRLAGLNLKEERGPLASPDELVRELIDQTPGLRVSPQFEQMAHELVTTRLNYLNHLEHDYEEYRTVLTNHSNLLDKLIIKIAETRSYIDQKALWIRNANPIAFSDLVKSKSAFDSFFNLEAWGVLADAIKTRIFRRPYETALGAFVMLGLLVVSRRLQAQP